MAIPSTSTIQFKHVSNLGKKYTENLYANPEVINTSVDSDTAVAVDDFCRALTALTTQTYTGDTYIISTININEIIEGGNNNG